MWQIARIINDCREYKPGRQGEDDLMIDLVKKVLGGSVTGRAICILGLSSKPDSDDVTDSPALAVAKALYDLAARVTAYDPVAIDKAGIECPGLICTGSATEAICNAEAALLLTEWPEFRDAGPEIRGKAVISRDIWDGRNALDSCLWRTAGWNVYALGQPNFVSAS